MLVTNRRDYLQLCDRIAKLSADTPIGIDTETTGVALWTKDVLRGVCIGFEGESFYVPMTHPDSENQDPTYLRRALELTEALPVFHNAQFDWRALEAGIGWAPPMDRYRDTQLLAWLQDENRRKGLKYLGALFFGEDEKAEQTALKELMRGETRAAAYKRGREAGLSVADAKLVEPTPGKTWATFTAEDIAPYAAKDAELTLRVYGHLLKSTEYGTVEPAVQTLHDVQAAAYRMTRRGVLVNMDRVLELESTSWAQATRIADEFEANIASAPQLAVLVYDTWGLPCTERTDSGAPSTAAAALEALAGQHPGLDRILEYRRLKKAEQFYKGLLEHCDANGRVHTSFNVAGTVTGRWSSSDPNLQQVPKKSTNADAWSCFIAPKGYVLAGFDLASAELYVAASLTEDEGMIAALSEEGRSFHRETARAVFGSDEEPFYTLAKNLNYGIPYGIGPKKFATYIAKGRKEVQSAKHYQQAKQAIDAHRAAWPELHRGIQNCAAYADITGRLPLGWPGAFRHFVSATMSYPVPSYQAFNSAVQGGVARFVNDVLLAVEAPAAELGAEPVLAVHDSLKFYVPADSVAELGALLQRVSDDANPFRMRMIWSAE